MPNDSKRCPPATVPNISLIRIALRCTLFHSVPLFFSLFFIHFSLLLSGANSCFVIAHLKSKVLRRKFGEAAKAASESKTNEDEKEDGGAAIPDIYDQIVYDQTDADR